jgi:hypothetical protein
LDDGYYGVSVTPGQQVDWEMLDMPCNSSDFDPADTGSVLAQLQREQANPYGTSAYAGTWQDARQRLG